MLVSHSKLYTIRRTHSSDAIARDLAGCWILTMKSRSRAEAAADSSSHDSLRHPAFRPRYEIAYDTRPNVSRRILEIGRRGGTCILMGRSPTVSKTAAYTFRHTAIENWSQVKESRLRSSNEHAIYSRHQPSTGITWDSNWLRELDSHQHCRIQSPESYC